MINITYDVDVNRQIPGSRMGTLTKHAVVEFWLLIIRHNAKRVLLGCGVGTLLLHVTNKEPSKL